MQTVYGSVSGKTTLEYKGKVLTLESYAVVTNSFIYVKFTTNEQLTEYPDSIQIKGFDNIPFSSTVDNHVTYILFTSDTSAYDWQNKVGETIDVELGFSSTKSLVKELIDRKVITTNKVVDITSGKLGENEGYAKDLFGTIHGDIYFSFAGSTIKREIMELYKDKSIPTNPRIVFKVKAFAGEVSTDFPEEVILLKINKTLTRHTFTDGDNIEYQLSDTEQIFTDGERFKFAIGQEDTRLIGNLSDIDVDTNTIEGKLDTVNANININTDKLTISENKENELATAIGDVKNVADDTNTKVTNLPDNTADINEINKDTEIIRKEITGNVDTDFNMTVGTYTYQTTNFYGYYGASAVGSISGNTKLNYFGKEFTVIQYLVRVNTAVEVEIESNEATNNHPPFIQIKGLDKLHFTTKSGK